MTYVSTKEAKKFFKVSEQTLRRWAASDHIAVKFTPGGHRRYLIPSKNSSKIIYCRVSSAKQKKDLQRQIQFMREKYPKHEIIQDIGSGINFKRKGFLSILQRIFKGSVSEVVISSCDRLARFDFEFFDWLFNQFGCSLICINKSKFKSSEQELAEDLLSIVTVFTARYHGSRKYKSNPKN
jgi:putative resolvase